MEKSELDAKVAEIAEPQPEPERRSKVAVLGFTESWQKAPFSDQSFEIWGLNELYQFIPRWDRWFDIHNRSVYENDRSRVSDHIVRLRAMTCPVYMQQHWDDIPNSVSYPMDAVAKAFPNPCPDARPYFTNSITFMLLLAIMEGYKELHIYGVDMAHDSEYCLVPETQVLTEDLRWIRIGDVQPGENLVGFDEHVPEQGQRKYHRATIERAQDLRQPCYRLHLADGNVVTASERHRWLICDNQRQRRWVTTDQLQTQDTAPHNSSRLIRLLPFWDTDLSWNAGYLAAAYDGEGHLSQDARVRANDSPMALRFTQRPNGMSSTVEKALSEKRFTFSRSTVSHKNALDYSIRGGRSEIIRFLGSLRPQRLLDKFNVNLIGNLRTLDAVPVVHKEFIGEQSVVGIKTTTGTFIAEGFASHNSAQRPSCEWAVGLAQGAGIKVYIPHEADLLKTNFVYGYEADAAHTFDRKLTERRNEMAKRMTDLDAQIAQLTEARAQYRGAIQDAEHILKNWKSN